jgi:hypothetical protein
MSTMRAFAVCLLLFATAAHARSTPRSEVDGVADAIANRYFDAARGLQIAQGLREAAKAGAFDGDTEPEALAAELTRRLEPLDHHFRVRWAPRGEGQDGPLVPRNGPARDHDTGIRDVAVLAGNIGYLFLGQFADFEFGRADQPARQAIDAALRQLSGTAAVIIDVRDNGGGSPHMVGYLVSAFVPPTAEIYNVFHDRDGSTFSEAPAQAYAHPRTKVPLYILINAHTVSAAESFAYTLQSAKRATVVGGSSGGAANPGMSVPTPEGFEVFVPTGSPVNPITHTNWEGRGVTPDVPAENSAALETAITLACKAAKIQACKQRETMGPPLP